MSHKSMTGSLTAALTAGAVALLIVGAQAAGQQGQTTGTATTAIPPTQPPTPTVGAKQSKTTDKNLVADRDEDFLKHAAQSAKVQIAASQLAVTKASNAEVKALAERIVADHTVTGQELMPFMTKKNMTLSDDDPDFKTQMTKHESLQKLTGAAFDKEYLEDMISDHEAAVTLYTNEAVKSSDEPMKTWAYKALPTLKEHLQIARDLKAKLFKK